MKLDELAGIKSLMGHTAKGLYDLFITDFKSGKHKLKVLGKGSNAVAFTNGTSVFKFWHRDSAYEKWVNYAMKNPSRLVPKFKSKIRVFPKMLKTKYDLGDLKYVKMELLEPCTVESIKCWEDRATKIRIWRIFNGARTAIRENYDIEKATIATMMLVDEAAGLVRLGDVFINTHEMEDRIKSMNPDIKDMLTILIEFGKRFVDSDGFDYSPDNMAMRGNQLVILDPASNEDDLDMNHILTDLEDIIPWDHESEWSERKNNDDAISPTK